MKWIPRISLRQLAALVVIVSLVLALIVASERFRRLKREHSRLRESIGYLDGFDKGNSYYLMTTGYRTGLNTITGSHLLRVANYQQYSLELTFYDGENGTKKTEAVDINDPIVAITYVPGIGGRSFIIQSTYGANVKTSLHFDVTTHDRMSFGSESGGEIRNEVFLYYFFYTPNTVGAPKYQETRNLTPKQLVQLCNKYRIQTVFFRIAPRDSE